MVGNRSSTAPDGSIRADMPGPGEARNACGDISPARWRSLAVSRETGLRCSRAPDYWVALASAAVRPNSARYRSGRRPQVDDDRDYRQSDWK
jgi:hypothetical protein